MSTQSQNITITVTRRPRRALKALLFGAMLVPLAWYIVDSELDYYASYSGVVVEKGMDCNFCLFSDEHNLDLYIVLQDGMGKRSKRYVTTSGRITLSQRWMDLRVGSFVVKDKGFGEFPYEPGKKPPAQPLPKTNGWVFVGIFLVLGAVAYCWRRSSSSGL